MPEDYSTSRRFKGINAWLQPGDLGPGELVDAANVVVLGSDLCSRPGLQGVLLAAQRHTAPVYVLGAFRKADGSTGCVYTSGGKVYQVTKSAAGTASTPTEILSGGVSLAINSAAATGCRLGKYFYFADGSAGGALYRTDLSSASAVPFQAAPTAAPAATLTNTVIDALTGGAWAPDALTGAGPVNRLPNSNFASLASNLPVGYTGVGASPDVDVAPQVSNLPAGRHWLKLDDPGEGIRLTAALANDPITTDAIRYAQQFYVALDFFQGDPSGVMTAVVIVYGYADAAGTNLVGQISHEFGAPQAAGGTAVTLDAAVSFAAFSTPIQSYRYGVYAGFANTHATNAPYVTNIVCFPFMAALATSVNGGQVEVQQPQALSYTGGTLTQSNPGTVGAGRGAGGSHLTRDFGVGSPQDWSAYSNVVLSLSKAYGITGLSLSLAFRQDGSAVRYYTNPFVLSADGLSATCDLSTVPATVRAAFRYVELVFGGDFTVPAGNGVDLLLFGPLTGAGSLSIGYADYSYIQTEVNAAADPANLVDVIESNPSPASGPLTPTVQKAEAALALGTALTNTATTHRALYRYGGVFVDNPAVGRLIAVVPVGADVALGADARNPHYAWNHATGVLTDNTPDSFLLQPGAFPQSAAAVVFGRDAAPTGIGALCAYHGRLIAAVGSTLYISWLALPTNPSACYFTLAQIPNDPNQAIKGAAFPVGAAYDNDPVQALIGTNTAVVIEKMTSKALLQGFDGYTFSVQDYLKGTGVGCVARRAACLLQNQEVALGSSGVFGYDIARVAPLSQDIEPLLRPKGWDGNGAIPASVFAGCCMAEWDRRLLLSAPAATADTHNTVTWVLDTRTGGWTRWTFGVTSIVSLSSGTDAGECFLGGYDGMLYALSGGADTASSDGAPTPIAVSVTSRGFGQEDDGLFWLQDKMLRVSALLSAPAATPVTFTVGSDSGLVKSLPPYTVSGHQLLRVSADDVRGLYLTVGLSCSVTGPFRLTALRAEIAEGARRSA